MEAQVSLLTINAISAVSALEWQQIAAHPLSLQQLLSLLLLLLLLNE
jgi:hypothetical protein